MCCICQIERVQNQYLYSLYQATHKQLEQANPNIQNERQLWHGTAREVTTEQGNVINVLQNINAGGFNRSYYGKNGNWRRV